MKKIFVFAVMLMMAITASAQNEKKVLCIEDFVNNAHCSDATLKSFQNEVITDIMATDRLTVVMASTFGDLPSAKNERLKTFRSKGVDYVLEGKLNSVTCQDKSSNEKKSYRAEVNFSLTVTDAATGAVTGTYSDVTVYNGTTEAESIQKAIETMDSMIKRFVDTYFKVSGFVKALDKYDAKKGAKTVYITLGYDAGISEGQIFEVYTEAEVAGEKIVKKIGEVKASEVLSSTLTLCKVKNGEKEIYEAFIAEKTMVVVSRAKKLGVLDILGGL